MKRATLAVAILALIFGCKKDPAPPPSEEPREPSEIVNAIVVNLKTADSISVFVDALKDLSLSAADVEEGITVFAPLNGEEAQAQQQALLMDSKREIQAFGVEELTPTVLKDHIVKGVIKLADLTNERILTSLSGKELKVSRAGNKIWINGIQIGSEEIGATADQIVYTVKELLSGTSVNDELQTTSLEVVVWDALGWTPERAKGTLAAGAKVALYRSQADYVNLVVAYEAEADTEGKALFTDIDPGEYLVVAELGNRRSIFHDYVTADGRYIGLVPVGIFQSEAEVKAAPSQEADGKPGNFQWMDTDSNGKINSDDFVDIPYEKAEVNDGRVKTMEVWVGYGNNAAYALLSPEEMMSSLQRLVNHLGVLRMQLAVTDAVLTGQVHWSETKYADENRTFADFSFNPSTPAVSKIWNDHYDLIDELNKLEPRTDHPGWAAEVRMLKAFVYLQLMTYFGNVPLTQEGVYGRLTNADTDAVYNFVKRELEEVEQIFSDNLGAIVGGKTLVHALLVRTALLRKDYNLAANHVDHIINSGTVMLSPLEELFDMRSPEYIWRNILWGVYPDEIQAFFFNRPSFPVLRYTEVLFTGVEAKLALGDKATAVKYFNQLIERDGWAPIDNSISTEELTDRLRSFWNSEMAREGVTFPNYVRWGVAADSLAHRGFKPHHKVLPIPRYVSDGNPQVSPTPGY